MSLPLYSTVPTADSATVTGIVRSLSSQWSSNVPHIRLHTAPAATTSFGASGKRRGIIGSLLTHRRLRLLVVLSVALLAIGMWLRGSDSQMATTSTAAALGQFTHAPLPQLKSLVIVAGHGIFTGSASSSRQDVLDEQNWALEPYQRGQQPTSVILDFMAHIHAGIAAAKRDPNALLVFSGGVTRGQAYGPLSEGVGYWAAAEADRWNGAREHVRNRTVVEDYARDSFDNLLFSICRFKETTGSYPQRISLVSYPRKRERFTDLHLTAIGYPVDRFTFIGSNATLVDDTLAYSQSEDTADASTTVTAANATHSQQGGTAPADATNSPYTAKRRLARRAPPPRSDPETTNNLIPFSHDPYACSHPGLVLKKTARNWGNRQPGYEKSCPELRGLLTMCETAEGQRGDLYDGPLPW
ncbi:hypothetical protein RI367_001115 [Sorochytrium milnesiophthora]